MKEYNYADIIKIDENGITLKDDTRLPFDECAANWVKSHSLNNGDSVCVAERDISAQIPYFLFYTDKKIKIFFLSRFLFWEFKRKKEYMILQKKISDYGYTTYDLS